MCRKSTCLASFVLMLGLAGSAIGQPTGEILFEYWLDIGGVQVADLTGQAAYPDDPDDGELRTAFDGPVDWRDNYGARARGYLYPPEGGDYTFWISGDDYLDLYLSTDDDPANAVLIAQVLGWTGHLQWDSYAEQQSSPVTLAAGGKYYIEALMKEGDGGDSCAVGWAGPGIGDEITVIAGAYLSPAAFSPSLQKAQNPVPADGAVDADVALLEWQAGALAVSHIVYLNGDLLAETELTLVAADLAPGTTYTWRVDEVQEDGTVIEGNAWSFTTIPLEAHFPNPPDGARFIDPNVVLSWTSGQGAVIHDVYFGTDEAAVSAADPSTFMGNLMDTSFDPGPLEPDTIYYWRVDEFAIGVTNPGPVWSFTVQGDRETAYNPNPADGAKFIDPNFVLSWTAGQGTIIHDVYFGTSIPPAFIGSQTETSYDFGALEYSTTYYWQVDEIEADGTVHPGNVWSFTTARPDLIFVLDDFDDYTDPAERWTPTGGARIGHDINEPGYTTLMETRIVHSGKQSMPLYYDNMDSPFSQADRTFSPPWDWTVDGANALTVYVYGEPPKFRETHRGDVVLSGAGADIWGTSDEFRFVYKRLNGNGSITARILSNGTGSSAWAKGGVMIRPGLDAGSTHGMMVLTGGADGGAAFQWRRSANDDSQSAHNPIPAVSPPYWVRIERIHNKLKGYLSQDGVNWTQQGEKEDIEMWKPKVFIGLCVTSHASGELRTYDFANVYTTGDVSGQWQVKDVGVDQPSNDLAPLYVAVEDINNNVAVVNHPDPNAVLADDWQEWTILFSEFSNAGVDLTAVKTISLGVGDRKNSNLGNSLKLFATSPGESAGKVFWGDGVLLTGANVGTTQLLLKATVRDICDGATIGDANNARLRFGGDPLYTNTAGVKYVPLTLGRDYDPVTVIADGFLMDYPHVWVSSDSIYPKRDFLLTPEPESLSCPIYCFRSSDSRYFYTLDKYESESQRYQEFRDRGDPVPSERDALLYNPNSSVPDDWTYECIAFCAWDSNTTDPTRLKAVCRFVRQDDPKQIAYAFTKEELDLETKLNWMCKDKEAFFVYPVDENGDPVQGTPNDTIKPVRRIWHENPDYYSYTIGGSNGIIVWYAYERPKP